MVVLTDKCSEPLFLQRDSITENHYIRFEWIYTDGEVSYIAYGPQLKVLSREVKGYTIDIGQADVYQATLITQTEAPTDTYYAYDKANNQYVEITETNITDYPYSANIYYAMSSVAYSGNIYYILEVGYGTDYVYNIYAVDESGNYLVYQDEAEVSPHLVRRYTRGIRGNSFN